MRDEVAVGTRAGTRVPTATSSTTPGVARSVVARRPSNRAAGPPVTAGERGAVTAEAAAVLPLLVAVALAVTWLVGLSAAQVRVVDAAREVARAAARGESDAVAIGHGRRVAPEGTTLSVHRSDGSVRAEARVEFAGPGGLLRFLPGVGLESTAVAAREPR